MKYEKIIKGKFVARPNRFVAEVRIKNQNTGEFENKKVHVKNTGRCREILIKDATVYIEDFTYRMGTRKMEYSLVTVEKEDTNLKNPLINMDSQMPNKVVKEAFEKSLKEGSPLGKCYGKLADLGTITMVKPEYTYGKSRIDFYLEGDNGKKALVEVKGVTLEENLQTYFPDAPTTRGVKHLLELEKAMEEGYIAAALFVIQMKGVKNFSPNDITHKEFGDTLRRVRESGVEVLAFDCYVSYNEVVLEDKLEIKL